MGCQCINKEEEELQSEVFKSEENLENEKEQYQYPLDNNKNEKEFLRSSNQEFENSTHMYGENNENGVENNQINDDKKNIKYPEYSEYAEKMLSLINKIRDDPVSYADIIEDSIKNIIEEQDKNDETKTRIIYKKKVKVALNRGESAFHEAAEELRSMNSLPLLELKNDICVPLPEDVEDIKDSSYLREQVKILRETANIDVFFKDLIKIPEVSALLMIVDDSGKSPGKKRQAVLNKDFKYIGISSKFIGNTFIAYFAFSK